MVKSSLLDDADVDDIIRLKLTKRIPGSSIVDLNNHLRLDYDKKPNPEIAKTIMKLFGPYFNGWTVVLDAYGGSPGAFIFHPNEIHGLNKSIYDYGRDIYHNNDPGYTNYSIHISFDSHDGTLDVLKKLIQITNEMDIKEYVLHQERIFSY